MVHSKVKNYFILHLIATMLPALAFIVTLATCNFGTYLQSGVCVVSCNSGTIGDSDTRECRDVQGELVVCDQYSIAHILSVDDLCVLLHH